MVICQKPVILILTSNKKGDFTMKHLFKSTKSAIALLLAAAFVCGGAAALARTESTSTTKKASLQALAPSGSNLSDDWDISDFI